jgi:hypothetical protein
MKKVITFSLWGDKPIYMIGSIENAKLAQHYYPDFECWFYIHKETVPQNIIDELIAMPNVSIIFKYGDLNHNKPMMWRFEAIDDPDVEIMMSRDTDTRILLREKLAVDEWLSSNKLFHIMRDHPDHSTDILGGMFGTKKNNRIGLWHNIMDSYIQQGNRDYDQTFLSNHIYPRIINNCIIHASFYKKENFCLNFPIDYDRERNFVGEYIYADGTKSIHHYNILLIHTSGSWVGSSLNYNMIDDILYASLYNGNGNLINSKTRINPDFRYLNNNGELQLEKCDNLIICLPCNQIGNCLRNIASMYLLAKSKNMNFCINLINVHSEKEKYTIKHLFPYINLIYDMCNNIHYSECMTLNKNYCTNYDLIKEGTIDINNEIFNKNIFGISELIYSVAPSNLSDEDYIKNKINFYKENGYFDELNKYYEQFINDNNLVDGYISIHIRYTDNLTDTNKNNNSLNTPLEIFYNKIDSLQNNKILICSDNINIMNELKNKNNNMYYFPNNINSLLQPMYEMYLLSKSKLIIGSTSSTFSYEAAFFQGTDIELYENNQWVLYELSKYK